VGGWVWVGVGVDVCVGECVCVIERYNAPCASTDFACVGGWVGG